MILDSEKLHQEQRSLTKIEDSFKKIIVVKDVPAPWHTDFGVLVLSVYDFLLNPKSMEA